jgi:hypothetical protein
MADATRKLRRSSRRLGFDDPLRDELWGGVTLLSALPREHIAADNTESTLESAHRLEKLSWVRDPQVFRFLSCSACHVTRWLAKSKSCHCNPTTDPRRFPVASISTSASSARIQLASRRVALIAGAWFCKRSRFLFLSRLQFVHRFLGCLEALEGRDRTSDILLTLDLHVFKRISL